MPVPASRRAAFAKMFVPFVPRVCESVIVVPAVRATLPQLAWLVRTTPVRSALSRASTIPREMLVEALNAMLPSSLCT